MTTYTALASVTDFLTKADARTKAQAVALMRERVTTNNFPSDAFGIEAQKRGRKDPYRWEITAYISFPVTVSDESGDMNDAETEARFLLCGGHYHTRDFLVDIVNDEDTDDEE